MALSRDSGLWAQLLRRLVGRARSRMQEVRQSVQRGAKVVLGCPECGTRYSVRQKDAERGVKCPKCNVLLPAAGGAGANGEHPAPRQKGSPPPGVSASLTETLVSRGRLVEDAPLPHHLTLTLTVLEGPDTGSRITLARTRTVLGRREAHVLLNDPEVSGLHAAIAVDGNRYSIRDLRSRNGTFLNGKRIEEAELAHLDEVRLGRTTLLFTVTHNSP